MNEVEQIQIYNGSPRIKTWFWRETAGFPAGGVFDTLIYDDSDQIILPPEARSSEWNQSATTVKLDHRLKVMEGKKIIIKHIDGHFYLLTEVY